MLQKQYVSRWSQYVHEMTCSPTAIYKQIEESIITLKLNGVKTTRVQLSEKGLFSNKREYLRISGKSNFFYVCVAEYGNGFYVSYWQLENRSSKKSLLNRIPFIGGILEQGLMPETFYTVDSREMFLGLIHNCIISTINDTLETKGHRKLTEFDARLVKQI